MGRLRFNMRDYTLWQHSVLGSESDGSSAIARQLGFWRERLGGLPQELVLPSDRPAGLRFIGP